MILHGYDLDATSRLSESFQQLQRESAGKLGLARWQAELAAECFPDHKPTPCSLSLHTHAGSLGLFNHGRRSISIHRVLCCFGDRLEVARTLLHEMAHSAHPPRDGDPHHADWWSTMMRAGVDPDSHEIIAGSLFAKWWERQHHGEEVTTMHRDRAVTQARRAF